MVSGERDVAVVAVDLSAERIQPEACDLSHGRPVVGAPAVERSEAEYELLECKRLREVVVSAELEPRSLVVEPIGRGGTSIVYRAEHNEEGGRFWRKSNENIIAWLDDESVIETDMAMFCWASLAQIKELALIDNVVSPFVKTIIAPL